jgi:hypothetical protein
MRGCEREQQKRRRGDKGGYEVRPRTGLSSAAVQQYRPRARWLLRAVKTRNKARVNFAVAGEQGKEEKKRKTHLLGSHRLGQVPVHPALQTPLLVAGDGRGGESDDTKVADSRVGVLANGAGGSVAVHDGHLTL